MLKVSSSIPSYHPKGMGLDGAANAQLSWSELCRCWFPCRSMNTCISLTCTLQYMQIYGRVVSVRRSESTLHLGPGLSWSGSNDPLTGPMHCSAGQACLQLCLSTPLGKVFIMLSCSADGIMDKCGQPQLRCFHFSQMEDLQSLFLLPVLCFCTYFSHQTQRNNR